MCLTLPIPSADRCTLDDCLKQLSADEYLVEESRWNCTYVFESSCFPMVRVILGPSCATLCNAKKNLTIHQLPPVLIIQLKR
jgi:ubiquitin C-terminal hydrolase